MWLYLEARSGGRGVRLALRARDVDHVAAVHARRGLMQDVHRHRERAIYSTIIPFSSGSRSSRVPARRSCAIKSERHDRRHAKDERVRTPNFSNTLSECRRTV